MPVVQIVDSAGTRVLRVRAAGASQVEVMGDFTNWEAQPLSRSGAVFERAVTVSSGSHRLLLRINGGEWRPAANTPSVDDDFGGKAGLLVVP
jgi:Glycogen recognition site of AMP-activated protein kinase